MNLIILFAALMPDMVPFRIFELMLETWTLISSRLMFESQFHWPITFLKLGVSLSFNLCRGSESCSLFSGMVFHSLDPFLKEGVNFNYLPWREGENLKSQTKGVGIWCRGRSS